MKKFKKIITMCLSVVMLLSYMNVGAFAQNEQYNYESYEFNVDENLVEQLISDGLTRQQAVEVLEVDRIIKILEENNQTIEYLNGDFVVTNSPSGVNVLTSEENKFIVTKFRKELLPNILLNENVVMISPEQAISELQTQVEENPTENNFRIDMGNGAFLLAEINDEDVTDENNNSLVAPCTIIEEEVESKGIPNLGRFKSTCEIMVYAGLYYTKTMVSVISDFKDNGYTVTMDTLDYSQASAGTVRQSYREAQISVPRSNYYENPTVWCEAYNKVGWENSSSLGLSINGISMSTVYCSSWEQRSIIRSSIAGIIHKYAYLYY